VVDYIDVRAVDGRVVAATHGNGLYSADFGPLSGSVEPAADGPRVRLWPNPARAHANLALDVPTAAEVRLFDPQGRLLRRTTVSGGAGRLDLAGIPAGVYVYQVTGRGWRRSGRLVRE
jgi:hypothetical protein